jgi:hypothetical protein
MNRKSSLLEISKAYEQILEEMDVNFTAQAQPEPTQGEEEKVVINKVGEPDQMYTTVTQGNTCSSCGCEENEEGECGCGCSSGSCDCDSSCDCGCNDEDSVHDDSNMDMAKSEIYKIKKAADVLMHLIPSSTKIEAWMLSKLIKASDYLCSLQTVIEYDKYEQEVNKCVDDFSNDMMVVSKITQLLNGEGKAVNEEVLKRIKFNLEILKENE